MIEKPLSVCFFLGVYKAHIKRGFDSVSSNIGHSVPFWSIFTVLYTYFGVLFYVCMYFEENTGPIRMHTHTA
jgi:preprotein translocase subunit SecF